MCEPNVQKNQISPSNFPRLGMSRSPFSGFISIDARTRLGSITRCENVGSDASQYSVHHQTVGLCLHIFIFADPQILYLVNLWNIYFTWRNLVLPNSYRLSHA